MPTNLSDDELWEFTLTQTLLGEVKERMPMRRWYRGGRTADPEGVAPYRDLDRVLSTTNTKLKRAMEVWCAHYFTEPLTFAQFRDKVLRGQELRRRPGVQGLG